MTIATLTAIAIGSAVTLYFSSKLPVWFRKSPTDMIPAITTDERLALWQGRAVWKRVHDGPSLSFEAFQDYTSEPLLKEAKFIETDVHRSYLPETEVAGLRHVLLAFAARRPHTGYTQGVNLIAACFLELGLTPAETYHALAYMLDNIGVHYLDDGMQGVMDDTAKIEEVITQCGGQEELSAVNLLSTSILPSLASATLGTQKTLRLWDAVLFFERRGWLASVVALFGVDCATKKTVILTPEVILETIKDADIDDVLKRTISALNKV